MENMKSDVPMEEKEQLVIRKFREGDFEGYRELFYRVFKKAISREFFNWKYYENPNAYSDPSIYLALNSEGLVVGARAMFPGRVEYMGKEYMAAQAGDTMVDERYRGRGIFKKLNQYALEDLGEKGCKVIFNFPNSNSYPGNIKMGWIHMGEVIRYFKVLSYRGVLKNKLPKVPGIVFLGMAMDYLISLSEGRKYTNYSIEAQSIFTKEAIEYMQLMLRSKIHHKRDEAYLNWKFIKKPESEYKVVVVRKDEKIASLFIIRTEDNNGLKLGNIMDYFGERHEDIKVGINLLIKYCKKWGFDYLSTWYISDESYERVLKNNMFLKRETPVKFVVKPLEEGLNFFSDISLWHVVYGDADTA